MTGERTRDGALEYLKREGRIVIVGASLAGLRAAETMREKGFTGSLTMIGDEPYEPYDRPPLSKQVLLGHAVADHTALPRRRVIDADWRLGVPATGLDMAARRVRLGNGDEVEYDRLLIATGVRARPWPNEEEGSLQGVFVLRTRDDGEGLQRALADNPRRVLVIGAGFTGSEIASACRERGLNVTVAERGDAPLVGALGGVIGEVAAEMHREHEVDLRTGVMVTALEGDPSGRVRAAHLSDGSTIEADVVVVSSARSATPSGSPVPDSAPAPGASPATRAAGPSTSGASSPTTSTWRVTWHVPRTRCSATSSCPWSTGATPSRRPTRPRTTCSARARTAVPTCGYRPSGPRSSA